MRQKRTESAKNRGGRKVVLGIMVVLLVPSIPPVVGNELALGGEDVAGHSFGIFIQTGGGTGSFEAHCDLVGTACAAAAAVGASACGEAQATIKLFPDAHVKACAAVAGAAGATGYRLITFVGDLGGMTDLGLHGLASANAENPDRPETRVGEVRFCPSSGSLHWNACGSTAAVADSADVCVVANANGFARSEISGPVTARAQGQSAACVAQNPQDPPGKNVVPDGHVDPSEVVSLALEPLTTESEPCGGCQFSAQWSELTEAGQEALRFSIRSQVVSFVEQINAGWPAHASFETIILKDVLVAEIRSWAEVEPSAIHLTVLP